MSCQNPYRSTEPVKNGRYTDNGQWFTNCAHLYTSTASCCGRTSKPPRGMATPKLRSCCALCNNGCAFHQVERNLSHSTVAHAVKERPCRPRIKCPHRWPTPNLVIQLTVRLACNGPFARLSQIGSKTKAIWCLGSRKARSTSLGSRLAQYR